MLKSLNSLHPLRLSLGGNELRRRVLVESPQNPSIKLFLSPLPPTLLLSPMAYMEGEGISATIAAEPRPSEPPHFGDVSVGSAEEEGPLVGDCLPSGEDGNDLDGLENDYPSQPAESSEELRAKIIKQVEYYFSEENLPTDKFLLGHIKKDKFGFVSITIIASFRKMKKLTKDMTVIVDALKESSLLVVSPDEKKVRRLHPLPLAEFKDPNSKLCTVLVENLPEDHSKENIQRIFGQVGRIKSICICDPHAASDLKQNSKAENLISGKLHALVEYEMVEAAEKAAVTLNDEKDWRTGLRVQLLHKRMASYSKGRKALKGSNVDKGSHARPDHVADEDNNSTSECLDDTHELKAGERLPKENDDRKGRNKRSKGHKYRGNSGMCHGSSTSVHIEAAKPPPGPRMPDGTRGFTMGRGRPPVSTQF